MSIPPYVLGYPPDGSSLGSTKLQVRSNLDGTFETLGVDHYDNNGNNANSPTTTGTSGYHAVIHMPIQSADPSTIGLTGQLYVKQVTSTGNTDEALFYKSGGGRLTQLTTNVNGAGNTTVASANGYSPLQGGVLMQWGNSTSNVASPNGTVTFPIAFPNNIFGVQICVLQNSNSRRGWHLNTITTSGFTAYIQDENGTSVANTFYWTAIGN